MGEKNHSQKWRVRLFEY